jgi:hypothetical protein
MPQAWGESCQLRRVIASEKVYAMLSPLEMCPRARNRKLRGLDEAQDANPAKLAAWQPIIWLLMRRIKMSSWFGDHPQKVAWCFTSGIWDCAWFSGLHFFCDAALLSVSWLSSQSRWCFHYFSTNWPSFSSVFSILSHRRRRFASYRSRTPGDSVLNLLNFFFILWSPATCFKEFFLRVLRGFPHPNRLQLASIFNNQQYLFLSVVLIVIRLPTIGVAAFLQIRRHIAFIALGTGSNFMSFHNRSALGPRSASSTQS